MDKMKLTVKQEDAVLDLITDVVMRFNSSHTEQKAAMAFATSELKRRTLEDNEEETILSVLKDIRGKL